MVYRVCCLLCKKVREIKCIPSAYCCTKKHGKVRRTLVRLVISSAWGGDGLWGEVTLPRTGAGAGICA